MGASTYAKNISNIRKSLCNRHEQQQKQKQQQQIQNQNFYLV